MSIRQNYEHSQTGGRICISVRVPKITDHQDDKSPLFSLVAFASHPLHLSELQDGIALALSDPSQDFDPLRRPSRLQLLFPPLIEIQNDPNESNDPLCILRHSTVQSFLNSNRHILCLARGRGVCAGTDACETLISPDRFGSLCLQYLSQPRYGSCLSKNQLLPSITDSRLLYCAKFWTKHLEHTEPTHNQRRAVATFVKSTNFQTLLQVQSLYVSGQFEQIPFRVETAEEALGMERDGYHHFQRQSFPRWLFQENDRVFMEYLPYRGQYRHFVNEWGYLLTRATCPSDQDYFPGEVERCLSGIMGPSSFLGNMKEKYPSFMLSQEPFDCLKSQSFVLEERFSNTSDRFMTVSVQRYVDPMPSLLTNGQHSGTQCHMINS